MSDPDTRHRVRIPLLPRWLRWSAVVAVAGFVFYTSVLTTPPETLLDSRFNFVPLDKWRHFLAYGALGSALAYALVDADPSPGRVVLAAFAGSMLFGIGIEAVQAPMATRSGTLLDVYANAIGCLAVVPWYLLARYAAFVPLARWASSGVMGRD